MTARQRILDFIHAHPGATSNEISRAYNQTPANARHHLAALERQGLVYAFRRPTHGRGRPEKGYTAAITGQGNSLAPLSELLLEAHLGGMPESEREARLRDLAESLGNFPATLEGSALPHRLSALMERLSSLHYQPRWEARAAGPQVVLGHCPFGAIIARHPELCQLDARLLERGLGARVRQLAKLEPNKRGLPICVFALV